MGTATLDAILADRAPPPYSREAFLSFLRERHANEGADFILAVERYGRLYYSQNAPSSITATSGPPELLLLLTQIIDTHLNPASPSEVNLPASMTQPLLSRAGLGRKDAKTELHHFTPPPRLSIPRQPQMTMPSPPPPSVLSQSPLSPTLSPVHPSELSPLVESVRADLDQHHRAFVEHILREPRSGVGVQRAGKTTRGNSFHIHRADVRRSGVPSSKGNVNAATMLSRPTSPRLLRIFYGPPSAVTQALIGVGMALAIFGLATGLLPESARWSKLACFLPMFWGLVGVWRVGERVGRRLGNGVDEEVGRMVGNATLKGGEEEGRWRSRVVVICFVLSVACTGVSKTRGRAYYFNKQTGESIWELPPGVTPSAASQDPAEVRASHILVKHRGSRRPASWREDPITRTKEEAHEIINGYIQRLNAGEDFAAIAKTQSDCSSASKGGDLGSFGKGKMMPLESTSAMKFHSPIPDQLANEFTKAASILDHFIKGNNKLDQTLIPSKIIANCKGVAVLTLIKAGFVWSGRAGAGLVVARLADGRWSAPCAIGAAGAGFGAQIGAELTDVVFILNTDGAVRAFGHGGNLTLGANVSVAAGPVGRQAEGAGTVANLAPIYSYSKTKGLFAGLSLEGLVIITRKETNATFYGSKVSPKDLLSGAIEPPPGAEVLYRALESKGFGSNFHQNAHGPVPSASAPLGRSQSTRAPPPVPQPSRSMSAPRPTSLQPPRPLTAGLRRPSDAGDSGRSSNASSATSSGNHLSDNAGSFGDLLRPAERESAGSRGGSTWKPQAPPPPLPGKAAHLAASPVGANGPPPAIKPKPGSLSGSARSSTTAAIPPPPPYQSMQRNDDAVVALYDFRGERDGDLSFKKGDRIVVTKRTDSRNDWWTGRVESGAGATGSFPANYVS
ncbi:hypothetical protein HK101_009875 [Irineochytrium annulatum]|nr:hypothetical protein HK101_009875 [Irineochytrium annulatum]